LKDTIGKQIVRSADSISSNIAEGYGRYFYKENKQFYFYSRGSIQETKSWLYKCMRRKIIKETKCTELIQKAELILIKLNAFIKFVSKSARHNPKSDPTN
jgi:four helix bundle protein